MEALLALWERLPLPGTARAAMSDDHLHALAILGSLLKIVDPNELSFRPDGTVRRRWSAMPPPPDFGPDGNLRGHDAPMPQPTEAKPSEEPETETVAAADVGEVSAEDLRWDHYWRFGSGCLCPAWLGRRCRSLICGRWMSCRAFWAS